MASSDVSVPTTDAVSVKVLDLEAAPSGTDGRFIFSASRRADARPASLIALLGVSIESTPRPGFCARADGQLGLVPKNYVTVLDSAAHKSAAGPAGPPTPDCDYISPSSVGRFAGKEWYYGKVTRHQAEVALNQRGVEGDFLIRDSESSPNDFSISLKAQSKNKHFKVQLKESLYCIGQRKFNSMEELKSDGEFVPRSCDLPGPLPNVAKGCFSGDDEEEEEEEGGGGRAGIGV
ncbi:Cytoplasmic protein NCK1 [Liparis tanakae]|uniref:Cytoplasmic protein NCK1 n=1 Tax=Liparis tanakae TaxID=230148 RepID=A0A4Z2JER5_9TELE|nr:Cytoplasmic protein NCK1 [Liparis tanakae]